MAFDGRVITDDYDNFTEGAGVYEVTDPKEACVAVAIGADVWDLPELCRLLPERPGDAADCPQCKGSGWFRWPTTDGRQGSVVCRGCGALGWLSPSPAELSTAPIPNDHVR